ncbi:MAG: response regulator transcription factor [Gluconacetobacter diazotrophicus]|nr:response regulator transcription factor [Gluconacetobacter diazotrophicus]
MGRVDTEAAGPPNTGGSPRVLVVEDQAAIGAMLARVLAMAGMAVRTACSGSEALALADAFSPEVVLLDRGLPDTEGTALIPRLARGGACGIILLTGRGTDADRADGIELGADDYVVKPPPLRELLARIRALHRRVERGRTGPDALPRIGAATVDLARRTVGGTDGRTVPLTAAEAKVLELLLARRGEARSRDELCEGALRRPLGVEDRSVDQLITALRRKLDACGGDARMILSVRSAGYALAP